MCCFTCRCYDLLYIVCIFIRVLGEVYSLGFKSFKSLCFQLPPILIILSRLNASYLRNQILRFPPKIDPIEERVHPSIDNAVAGVEFSLVMIVMFFMAYDES